MEKLPYVLPNVTESQIPRLSGRCPCRIAYRLVLPAADHVEFAPLVVRAEGRGVAETSGARVEVVLDRVTVRLDAAVPAGRLAEIVSALNASS